MSQVYINSGAAAVALAHWIIDNVVEDPSCEGVIITQQAEGIYVGADLKSANIALDGEVGEA